MDPAIIVAIIALVASLLSATVTLFGDILLANRKSRNEVRLAVATYRETLADAAYELQARLFNILEFGFLPAYFIHGEETEREYAMQNTLYVVAQYFAWVQALRREVHLGRFAEFRKQLVAHMDSVARLFGSDDPALGSPFRVWRGEQQAIGEIMLYVENGRARCLSYASFVEHKEEGFRKWFARLERDVGALAAGSPAPRLSRLQNALVDLIRELDATGRYSDAPLSKTRVEGAD